MPTPAHHRRLAVALTAGIVTAFLVLASGVAHGSTSGQRGSATAAAGATGPGPQAQALMETASEDLVASHDLLTVGPAPTPAQVRAGEHAASSRTTSPPAPGPHPRHGRAPPIG